jgi:hypothetical protein
VTWTVTVNSGNNLSNTFVNLYSGNASPTQTPANLGVGNTQMYALLSDTRAYSSSNPPLTSNLTVTAAYVLSNGASVSTNTHFVLNVTPAVPPSSSGGGGGGCVAIDQFTPSSGKMIGDYKEGDNIEVCIHKDLTNVVRQVSRAYQSLQPCYKLTTESGANVTASASTPMESRDGERVLFPDMLNKDIPVRRGVSQPVWEKVVAIDFVGDKVVNRISIAGEDLCYWAGGQDGVYISTHNVNDGGVGGRIPYKKL